MVNASFINRLSHAVDVLENRSQQNRPLQVRRGLEEDPDAALDRHFAAHPEDRGANIVIFKFCDDEGTAEESRDCGPPAGPACEEGEPRRF
jgi:hypothetical protein